MNDLMIKTIVAAVMRSCASAIRGRVSAVNSLINCCCWWCGAAAAAAVAVAVAVAVVAAVADVVVVVAAAVIQTFGGCECVKKQLMDNCPAICKCLLAQGLPVGNQKMCEDVCK
jgi:hypothetical protein